MQKVFIPAVCGQDYFQQAVGRDPQFALAHCGIANSYILLGAWGGVPPDEAFAQAKAAAMKALGVDPDLAEAHTALAMVRWLYEWDWAAADQEFRLAIASNPRHATAHHWYALHLAEMGRFDEAVASVERALEITPLSLPVNADKARVLFYARRYDESLAQYRKTIEMGPSHFAFYSELNELYEQLGMAEEWHSTAAIVDPAKFPEKVSGVTGRQAITEHYRRFLARLPGDPAYWLRPYRLAEIYARLGETARAVKWLNMAYEKRHHHMAQLRVNPVFDPLRSDPRFQELLRRMNLVN